MNVNAYRCDACDEMFAEPAGPLFECSRCSGRKVGDDDGRRCDECRIFMAKLADECCPGCESEEISAAELWEGADGELYESQEAEEQYVAEAPVRAQSKVESDEWTRQQLEERRQANKARNARMLPDLHRLMAAIGDRAPRLLEVTTWAIELIERDEFFGGMVQACLYFEELAALLAPGHDLKPLKDHGIHFEQRRELERPIRTEILRHLTEPPTMVARVDDEWFCYGSGLYFDLDTAAVAVVLAINRRTKCLAPTATPSPAAIAQ